MSRLQNNPTTPVNSIGSIFYLDEHILDFGLNKKVTFQVSFVFEVIEVVEIIWFLVFTMSRTSRIFKAVFMHMILVFKTISPNIKYLGKFKMELIVNNNYKNMTY